MRLLRLLYRRPPPILPSIAAYALWADHYPPHAHNVLMQTEQIAMLDMLPDVSGRVVLDLACGTGRYSLLARARGASRVI
jgi:malonyl-CoA O-methyltransferase